MNPIPAPQRWGWLLLVCLLLAACTGGTNSPTVSPAVPTTAPSATPNPAPKASPTPTTNTLTLWLPPQFDPAASTAGAAVLRARLDSFAAENPGIKLVVRIKAASGPGGLLDSLSATSSAAPNAMPALVALSRSDLEAAALKGLITPWDGLSKAVEDPNWYAYGRQLSLIQGSTFGLPFAGDALGLVYRPSKITTPPVDWNAMVRSSQPLLFATSDPQGLLTLLLYQSAGGAVADAQGRPILQIDPLTRTLRQYTDGQIAGLFPAWLMQYQTEAQLWQAFRDNRAPWMAAWATRFLSEPTADIAFTQLPNLSAKPFTLATGWVWAIADPVIEHRAQTARLAEYLLESDFLARWTEAAGYLPTRPTVLAAWQNQNLRALLSPIVLTAQVRPSGDLLSSLNPSLENATLQVIKQQADPLQTAQAAVERLTPQTK